MLWILLTLVGLILAGVPLFVVIGGVTVACFAVFPQLGFDNWATSFDSFTKNFNMLEKMVALADEPTLVAIPFFMIAGAIMSRGAIAQRLVGIANAMFGWLPGGLAVSAVVACMFFAAISGSSPVTVITIGGVMFPALVAKGYSERFSLGLVTSAGSLGIIIPPSIPMIIYAIFASAEGVRVSIEDLFIAGIGPGILIGLCLALYCVVSGRHVERDPFSWAKLGEAVRDGLWSLTLPLFILGGIYIGVFSATQAAAISVILALFIELLIHKQLKFSDLPDLLSESAVLMGSILIIITLAFGFNEFLTIQEIPEKLRALLERMDLGPIGFVIVLNIFLLIVGALMDIISAIILFVPLVAPAAIALGFDPLHLGLIFIVNLEIGYLTPPVGLNLFVSAGYFERSFGQIIRSVVPFVGLLIVSLGIITFVPRVTLQTVQLKTGREIAMSFPDGTQRHHGGGLADEQSVKEMMKDMEFEAPEDMDQLEKPEYDDYDYGFDPSGGSGSGDGPPPLAPPVPVQAGEEGEPDFALPPPVPVEGGEDEEPDFALPPPVPVGGEGEDEPPPLPPPIPIATEDGGDGEDEPPALAPPIPVNP
jgi:C4-dicarboxylate transporter DctM subunit